jgi:hypothetical protein
VIGHELDGLQRAFRTINIRQFEVSLSKSKATSGSVHLFATTGSRGLPDTNEDNAKLLTDASTKVTARTGFLRIT